MIISVSRRTDIPAFYSDWFYERIKKGFVYTRNPMNIHQISKIDLNPKVVDCFVFWTKNPTHFMKNLNNLDYYNYYFQFTITGYGKKLEPNVPSLKNSIENFKKLSRLIGKNRVIWRYDPIIITEDCDIHYHIKNFEFIASQLTKYTDKCIISFVDYYKKTVKNMVHIKDTPITKDQIYKLATNFVSIGKKYGLIINSCAEKINLENQGIEHGKCIDNRLIEEISDYKLKISKDNTQRTECGCVTSIDIGAYNTCLHGCVYCYANYISNKVKENYALHDKKGELLYGSISEEDKITTRKIKSYKITQQRLFGL